MNCFEYYVTSNNPLLKHFLITIPFFLNTSGTGNLDEVSFSFLFFSYYIAVTRICNNCCDLFSTDINQQMKTLFFFFNKWKLLRIMVIFFHLQSYFTWNAWDIKHQSFHWLSNFVILNRNWSLATNLNYIAGYKMKSFCASFPSLSPRRKKKKMPNVNTNLWCILSESH